MRFRNLKTRHSKKGQSLTQEEEKLLFDTSQGLCGVLYQVSKVVVIPSNTRKFREICLACLNYAVAYIVSNYLEDSDSTHEEPSKKDADQGIAYTFIEEWSDKSVKEKYFSILRCALLHQRREIRIGGLRLLRYLIRSEDDVICLISCNIVPLIVRSIDICIDNHNERVHGVRLARCLMQVSPHFFTSSLARCLIGISKDGARERDKLLRSAQAIVNELAILNPQIFIDCGGVSSSLYGILDCSSPRVNEALMSGLLFLLNGPKWRKSCSQFHMIMAPFSDIHYRHHEYDLDYSKTEERDLRIQSSCYALLTAFRSWPGLITLYQPGDHTIETIINLLRVPNESTRQIIVEFMYDLFRIPIGENFDDYGKALKDQVNIRPPDVDAWRLHEGFVVAEGKSILSHIAKFRPNLMQNYFSLILYIFIKKDVLASLCEVVVTSSEELSIKSTILIGEILHLADRNIPDCGIMSHALPVLSEKAAGSDPDQRMKASEAINALLQLSRVRAGPKDCAGMSLYLRSIIEANRVDKDKLKVIPADSDPAKISRWLGKEHDDVIHQTLKDSGVLTDMPPNEWKWHFLIPILRWPSTDLLSLEDSVHKSFVKKLINYFKPSSKKFSQVDATHKSASSQAEALLVFVEFLLKLKNDEHQRFLVRLLEDICSELQNVVCELPYHDSCMSPSHLNLTVCQYYFLAIGTLSRFSKGFDLVCKAGIYDQMMAVIDKSVSDIYAKLFTSTLDYSINGLNRTILSKVMTSGKECSRIYATQLLRVLLRARARYFSQWGVELLVVQLYDESKLVAFTALDVLDEVLDDEECLEAVLRNPPSLQHLGDKGQLIFAKFIGSPLGFRTFHDSNFISNLLDKWDKTFNLKYVKLMETALAESLTHLQRGEDGLYGRRTGSKHVVHDVFLLPHIFGSLILHKEGFSLLLQHESLSSLIQVLRKSDTSSYQDIYKLKSAIWALGHIGVCTNGVAFLESENLISKLVHLSSVCPVYSVRGTVFHALCILATSWEGVIALHKHGWESVRRNHQENLQLMREKSGCDPSLVKNEHLIDPELRDTPKAGFYFMDESEDETESFSIDESEIELLTNRKSQTLPHDSKPPSYLGHQRSFSDCAPLMEELSAGVLPENEQELTLGKRTARLKNKILSSFRKKSSKRRDSVGSRASNSSSTSEKMLSFFHRSKRKRGRSVGSSGRDDDQVSSLSQSCTDDELILDDSIVQLGTPRSVKLPPIASSSSLSRYDSSSYQYSDQPRDPSAKDFDGSLSYEDKKNYLTLSPPRLSNKHGYGVNRLRSVGVQRRAASESSHDDLQSKNSLRDFLSSSYDQASYMGLPRSPSGCSELSSVRSFGTLTHRVGGPKWVVNKGYDGLHGHSFEEDQHHPGFTGTCFLGLCIPLDTDKLLLEMPLSRNPETSLMNENAPDESSSVWEYSESDARKDRKKYINERRPRLSVDENSALEFHTVETCLRCSNLPSLADTSKQHQQEVVDGPVENIKLESPRLDRVRECSKLSDAIGSGDDASHVIHVSSIGSENFEDSKGSNKLMKIHFGNRFLVRKEVLRFISNLSTSFIAKSSESGVLALKTQMPWAFQDPCLYAEVCALLSIYPFRLNARRFIQELFIDLSFKEVFEDAARIMNSLEDLYSSLNKKFDFDDLSNPENDDQVPEYSANEFEDFDMG